MLALDAAAQPAAERLATPAFAEVFEAYAPYVLKLLRRLGVRADDLDDVAQEVFLALHHKLPSFEGRSSLRTWISGISLRQVLEYRRRNARRQRRVDLMAAPELESPADNAPDAEATCAQREQAALLEAALDKLAPAQRAVFVLYEIEELSMNEVAEALGCPRFTAYTRLYAARRQVRAHFEGARAKDGVPCR